MAERTSDIVSSIEDRALATRIPAAEARAAGRYGYDKPTAENSIVLLVDHQVGLMLGMRDTTSLAELRSNVIGLARTAKALGIPTLITSSNAQWQNGDNLPEIKELFSDQPVYRRTGTINCYEDPTFRRALEDVSRATGRRHIIIAAVTIGTCCALPTLSMLNDGYAVYPVVDACGAWNRYKAEAAMSRMANAGAELATTFALACELQADWKRPTADAMLEPFVQNLPEYGLSDDFKISIFESGQTSQSATKTLSNPCYASAARRVSRSSGEGAPLAEVGSPPSSGHSGPAHQLAVHDPKQTIAMCALCLSD